MAAANRLRRRQGSLTAQDDGLAALAVELARQLDLAAHAHQPYAVAQIGRVLADVEAQLGSRAGGGDDAFRRFLDTMSTTTGDAP